MLSLSPLLLAKRRKYATLRGLLAYMDKQFSNFSSYTKPPASAKKRAFIYVLLFVVLIGLAIVAGNYFLSSKKAKSKVEPTPTPTPPIVIPTATPTASPSGKSTPTPTVKVSPTAKVSPTVSPTTAVSKTLTIQVLNGSGTKGEAGKVASLLKAAGYSISSTGNADTFDYQKTVIQIKKSKLSYATQLKKDLSASYTVDPTVQTLAESSEADAIVIVGAE